MRAIALSLALSACGGKDADDTDNTEADGDADTDGDTDADSDSDTDADVEPEGTITGKVVWEDGTPAEGIQMRLCYKACRPEVTDADGVYVFDGALSVTQGIQALKLADFGYASPSFPVAVPEEDTRTLDDLVLPEWAAYEDLGSAGDVDGDHGLVVMADKSGMSAGSYAQSDDTFFASVWMDPSTSGVPFDGVKGTVIGMWHLGNFANNVDPGWLFWVEEDLGLSAGDTVQVLLNDTDEHTWHDAGTATVDSDGVLVSDGSTGITMLTTLLLVKP